MIFSLSKDPLLWLQAATLSLLFLAFSIWMVWGRSRMRAFFLGTVTLPDGRPDTRNLTMFTITLSFNFLIYRGAISFQWPPQFVFITLAVMISTWLGLDIWKTISQVKAMKEAVVSALETNEQAKSNESSAAGDSQGERP